MYDLYRDRGLIVLSLLYDISTGEQAMTWAESHGLTHPVLVDAPNVGARFERDWAVPSFTLIGPGAEILVLDGTITTEEIEAHLPG